MVFSSYVFWTFFAIVLPLYWLLNHRWQNRLLLAASYVFYGWWDWRFLFLLAGTSALDYFVGLAIDSSATRTRRRNFLLLSIFGNLITLGFFKYYGFFSGELVRLLGDLGLHASLPVMRVILPVGISFYTFQELSYTVDVYRGELKPARNLFDFALYVSFFPQLVAGPIERSGRLLPQILTPRIFRPEYFGQGLYHVLLGMFLKVVVADNMASLANTVFVTDPSQLRGSECLVGIYAFALQIYGDFAGYSFIAMGIARWMGFDLMTNFRMPYLADSPSDFWRRWHISLSTWLRDYLYIPLGGNRGSTWKTYRNLMITMTLGGLWHGARWTFVIWGIYHGLLLCIWRPFQRREGAPPPSPVARAFSIILMFHLVCLGWLLFRAESMTQVWTMLRLMLTDLRPTHFAIFSIELTLFLVLPMLLFEVWLDRKDDLLAPTRVHWMTRGLAYSYLVLMLQLFPAEIAHEFIYFQF